MKAKLFLNYAMDIDCQRTFEEQALWASLALELLGKSALARVSPLLIAEPNEEGSNLLIASGLVEGTASFMSVAAKTIFVRCARAFRPFSQQEAMKIAAGRNEYLHGGSPIITQLPPHAWWPRFWAQAVILVTAQDKTIEDLVGGSRVQAVEEYLATNRENVQHRATAAIERAKQRSQLYQSGGMSARLRAEWVMLSDQTAGLLYRDNFQTCPACGELGVLEGQAVEGVDSRVEQVAEDDFDAWVELTVQADYFSCPTCRLVLEGYELIEAAGLPGEFTAEGDTDDLGPEYGND
jgi:hypothetical protein